MMGRMSAPTILISIDLAGRSSDTCFTVLDLAGRLRARVVLVHCLAAAPGMKRDTVVTEVTAGELLERDAHKHAEPLLTLFREGGVAAELELSWEPAKDALVKSALAHQALLIALGVQPRTGLKRVFSGESLGDALAALAPCPVLLVRGREDEGAGYSTAQFQMLAETDG